MNDQHTLFPGLAHHGVQAGGQFLNAEHRTVAVMGIPDITKNEGRLGRLPSLGRGGDLQPRLARLSPLRGKNKIRFGRRRQQRQRESGRGK